MAQQWGRKETIIWPPHAPIYTYSAILASVMCFTLFCLEQVRMLPVLQRSYLSAYARSTIGSQFHQSGKYNLIYIKGPRKAPRLAVLADFADSVAQLSEITASEGYSEFRHGAVETLRDVSLARWLRAAVFEGNGLFALFRIAVFEGIFVLGLMLGFAIRADMRRFKELKYGRRLKGPVMLTPRQFNKTLKADGLSIQTDERGTKIAIPAKAEAKHIQVMGDTGTGKTTLLLEMLQQIELRGDSAIVYDTEGEYTEKFYSKERGDWILNPLDARCPYWTPAAELRNHAEARTLAASLYQPTSDKKGEFFTETPQKIFAHLLKFRPSPQQLVAWMSNEAEIDRRVEGTELAAMIAKGAQQQRSGVLGSLGLIADSLRLLPTEEQADKRAWSANEWSKTRQGWIFLTSTENTQDALRPLQSLWLDSLILRLLTRPKPGQNRAWFVIDELASLQRLPQFHNALTKARKSQNPIIFGYQGKAQLEVIYGHLAEVMLSQPSTKYILKTSEGAAAKWASELIGEVEIERVRETVADGKRAGKSFMMDRQVEPLVLKSELQGLADLHAFVKHGNYVSRFSFPPMSMRKVAEPLVPRVIPETELWLQSATLVEHARTENDESSAPPAAQTEVAGLAIALRPDDHRRRQLDRRQGAAVPIPPTYALGTDEGHAL